MTGIDGRWIRLQQCFPKWSISLGTTGLEEYITNNIPNIS